MNLNRWQKDMMPELKQAFQSMQDEMNACLSVHKNAGLQAMFGHAKSLDVALCDMMNQACFERFPELPQNPTLIAVGGYGRGELAPYSDIDILFLVQTPKEQRQSEIISFVLYQLWDLGLKVGHAVRTIEECIQDASSDMTVRTNLLESRFVWGDIDQFYAFEHSYERLRTKCNGQDFFDAKINERLERYKRMGQSKYMLEPNVKEGRGGLRDLHVLFWLAKYLFGVTDVQQLVERDILDKKTVVTFLKAHQFLSTVRCYLHLIYGRANDVLTFEAQKEIAIKMGYLDRLNMSAVERFMKHYYLVCKNVGALTQLMTTQMEERLKSETIIEYIQDERDFILINNKIAFDQNVDLNANPMLILKAFALKQRLKKMLYPKTVQSLSEKAKLIRKIRKQPVARWLFFEILMSENTESTMRLMNETNVLGYFIPVFAPLVAQVQFDLYHTYTTDEHTLKAIGFLALSDDLEAIQSKKALYIATLLHDVGKGRGGDHAIKGRDLAKKTVADLGLDDQDSETVLWLISQHLLMAQVAFRRDIYDPQTISDFVKKVQSPERLRLLYALTVADIKAVGETIWNGFKEKLLKDLFKISLKTMQGEDLAPLDLSDTQKELANLPASNDFTFKVSVDFERGVTELSVLAPDHDGLFAEITGAFALIGVSVVEAKIMTLENGMALDTFLIQEVNVLEGNTKKPLDSDKKIKRLCDKIRNASKNNLKNELGKTSKIFSQMWFPPRVFIDNEASNKSTLIEINGNDYMGFLYDITHTMTDLKLKIVSAHIYTYGSYVVDVFYVTDAYNQKITHEPTLACIKQTLLTMIEQKNESC